MKFRGSDDLRELLHVLWLDVDDSERLVGDFEVPEVDSEVVRRNVGFSVTVWRDRVDVIRMCV